MRRGSFWSWFWIILGFLYFFLPLFATFMFSLRAERDTLSFLAYQRVLADDEFFRTFLFSVQMALWTVFCTMLLIVPTAFWVHLRLPQARPVIELVTLMPFVIPAVVLVFGLIRTYSRPPFVLVSSPALLIAGYMVLSLPYMYRVVDTGLRAFDVRTLTEAALSLGANWPTIILRVIFPNLRVALLGGAFLTFAIVIGEFTLASLLSWPAFGPYLARLQQDRAYEPAALAILSFGLTWGAILLIQWLGRGREGQQSQISGTH